MADYDSKLIKPVDGLKNITGISPVKHREDRKSREQLHHENKEKDESAQPEETPTEERTGNKRDINSEGIGIDYCA